MALFEPLTVNRGVNQGPSQGSLPNLVRTWPDLLPSALAALHLVVRLRPPIPW